ncbi:MAG: MBL fold metallo-hydrolase [Clostridia bacterium]|nr:MBL fold metallo-hydrolase [Clostridia bacterium]
MTRFCSLVSGSSGNALYLEHKNTKILIDCGISCARICEALKSISVNPAEIDGIVVTHEHSDHVSGVRVFSNKFGCKVYAGEKTLENISSFEPVVVNAEKSFCIGEIEVMPFDIPHDAAQPFGYTFMLGKTKLSVATDMGRIDAHVAEKVRGSEFVFLESNHDINMLLEGPYPYYLKERIRGSEGHLSNEQCASLATALARTGTKRIVLGHLSNTNNTPELALKTVSDALSCEGFKPGDVLLDVAKRHSVSKIYKL